MHYEEWPRRIGARMIFRRRLFTVFLFFLLALTGIFAFLHSSYFTLREIVVEGNKYLTADDIIHLAGIDPQINVFRIDGRQVKKQLTRDFRIQDVEITRRWPATLVLTVRERRPVAFVAANTGFVELDGTGQVVASVEVLRNMSIPMVTGIQLTNPQIGERPDLPPLRAAVTLLVQIDDATLNELSEINVANPQNILAYSANAVPIRIGSTERLTQKARFLQDILKDIRERKLLVEYIDLSYENPVIKFHY